MVTRSEAYQQTWRAWTGQPCPSCGRKMPSIYWDEDGVVSGYCAWCDTERYLGVQPWPLRFDPEPDDSEDLPF